MCNFNLAWVGGCKESPEPKSYYCSKHQKVKCVSCGEQATHECSETMGFVCGEPLCDNCEHTIRDNGCNSGGLLPENLGNHCKKSEQVFKPWYIQDVLLPFEHLSDLEIQVEFNNLSEKLKKLTQYLDSWVYWVRHNNSEESYLNTNSFKELLDLLNNYKKDDDFTSTYIRENYCLQLKVYSRTIKEFYQLFQDYRTWINKYQGLNMDSLRESFTNLTNVINESYKYVKSKELSSNDTITLAGETL